MAFPVLPVIAILIVVILVILGIIFWDSVWGQILFWAGIVIGVIVLIVLGYFLVQREQYKKSVPKVETKKSN